MSRPSGVGRSPPVARRPGATTLAALVLAVFAPSPVAATAPAATAPAASSARHGPEPPPRPSVRAASAIVVDARSGEVLLEKRADTGRAIASATKLMTALLALERARPNQEFEAAAYRGRPVESQIGLREGERLMVRDLLTALLLESANDAAVTIAENVSGSRAAFVREMNSRARALGLARTRFANPIGLDSPRNFATARDLATLGRRLMGDRRFARIVDLPSAALQSGTRRRVVANRNGLVGRFPFVDGIKTGHTQQAGYVLVGSASGRGARVVSVVLGAPSESVRDADTISLLRYGIAQFRRIRALSARRILAQARVRDRDGLSVGLKTPRDIALTVRRGERIERRVLAASELEGPLPRGAPAGRVELLVRGRVVRTAPLVTAEAVPTVEAGRGLVDELGSLLTFLGVLAIVSAATLALVRRRAAAARRRAETT